ncbi:MAG: ornithine carbamoyltransferase [Pseudomonadota bacterium]
MMNGKRKRDLLTVFDLSGEETLALIKRAARMKSETAEGRAQDALKGKSVALIFEKASTRTRISFEVGVYQLGGQPLFITSGTTQMGRGEPIKDTARVLSRYVSMIMLRTYAQATLEQLAGESTIPIINGLSDLAHPCQVLSDLLTVAEKKIEGDWESGDVLLKGLRSLKIAWVGDGNNMANSWIAAGGVLGLRLALACPAGYGPNEDFVKKAASMGAQISISDSPGEAAGDADVINTDVWSSMGQEEEAGKRKEAFTGYCVDGALMNRAKPDSIFMHCLPAHREEEVSDQVFESKASVVWDQAENRLHMQKAIMEFLIRV